MVSHIYLSLSIYLSIYLGNTKGWPVIRLSTACCRDPDAFRGEPLGRHTATLANLHIQKAGGTAQFKNCEQHCLEARRRLDLKALGHDIWSRASGTRCGCEALFDHHWGAAELEAIQSVARAHEVQLELMTVLRDPVARVLSEYSYLLHNRGAMTQDQWDYTDRRGPRESGMFMSPLAHRLVEQSQRSHRFMPLEEFVEMAPGRHPAHNRQTRYVNGFRRAPWRPQGGCCHLTGARFVIDWFSMRTGPAGTRAMIQLMHGLERDANQSQLEESGDGLSAGLPPPLAQNAGAVGCHRLRTVFAAVGVLERANETATLLQRRFGWPPAWMQDAGRKAEPEDEVVECGNTVAPARLWTRPNGRQHSRSEPAQPPLGEQAAPRMAPRAVEDLTRHFNTQADASPHNMTPALRARILKLNEHDMQLYRCAEELLTEELQKPVERRMHHKAKRGEGWGGGGGE